MPVMATNEHSIKCAYDMILLRDEVANHLQISHGSVYEIIHNRLWFNKVCARWAPK